MQIVVTELPIEDAVGRARARLEQADRRLARALSGRSAGLAWTAPGIVASVLGAAALTGMLPFSAEAARAIGMLTLVSGGLFLGYGLALWSRARKEQGRRAREWRHALDMLRLREQQAHEDPGLTVEVLDRLDGRHPRLMAGWNGRLSATARYVQ